MEKTYGNIPGMEHPQARRALGRRLDGSAAVNLSGIWVQMAAISDRSWRR